MRIGYYPGCALEGSARDYALSLERLFKEIGVELELVKDWNCCGASAAHSINYRLSINLPYRNLVLANRQGLSELFTPCPFCSNALINTNFHLTQKVTQKNTFFFPDMPAEETQATYNGRIKIINSIEVFNQYWSLIEPKINPERLKGLKVACYYGCMLVRPNKIVNFDDPEQPRSMDQILKKLGVEPLDWEFKTECCGGGFTICNEQAVLELSHRILEDAKQNGAEAIIVACPMCHINLDMRQSKIEKKYRTRYQLPIIYLPQLIGLAIGIEPEGLGLNLHFVDTASIVRHRSNSFREKLNTNG